MSDRQVTLEVSGEDFVALEFGDLAGDVVLCLHGFPDHPPNFAEFGSLLAARGFRVVVPWLRGYHPSPLAGDVTLKALAQDARELLAACRGKSKRAFIVGHDWGAVIAYQLLSTNEHGFTGACAISVPHPAAFVTNALRSPKQLARSRYMLEFQRTCADDEIARAGFSMIRELWERWSPNYELEAHAWERLKTMLAASNSRPLDYYRSAATLASVASLWRLRQQRIRTPTTTIFGAQDGCIAPEMARGSQKYFDEEWSLDVIEGAGHFLHLEAPSRLAKLVTTAFARATARV